MMTLPRPARRALGLAALALALAGCGNDQEVRGTVMFDGKPLATGGIAFEPADGNGPTGGGAIVDGKYELTGPARLPPGPKVVRIRGSTRIRRKAEVMPGKFEVVDDLVPVVPPVYNDRSTLTVEIKAGQENVHNFDLKKADRR